MTWAQFIVVFALGLAFPSICLALWWSFGDRNYITSMTPDEEYRWLTEVKGLSHEAAQEYMHDPPSGG